LTRAVTRVGNRMEILITGVNGFIGHHLANGLIARGYSITGLGQEKECLVKGISSYFTGSVLDKGLIQKVMESVEVVIHLAALTGHKDIVDNRFTALEINFLGTKNVLDAFSKSKAAKKFIYSSTGKVYGRAELPFSEQQTPNPLNILGKSKLITEKLIDFYNDNKKEFIILRIFNAYGPKQSQNFLIPTILGQLDSNKIVLGDVKAKRDYVYIEDVIKAFISAIEKKMQGLSIFNVCTRKSTSAEEIVEIVSKIKGIEIKVKNNSSRLRSDEVDVEYGLYDKAKDVLGWEPKYGVKEGLTHMIKG